MKPPSHRRRKEPYYKVQYRDSLTLAWKDRRKEAFDTFDDALSFLQLSPSQAVEIAEETLHAAQTAYDAIDANSINLKANSQQRVDEAQQAVANARKVRETSLQSLQRWEAIRPAVAEVEAARQRLAAAEQTTQAARDGEGQQAVEQARQVLQMCQQAGIEAEQAAQQALAQNPPTRYLPIPDSAALLDKLRSAFRGLAQHHSGSVPALDPTKDGYFKSRWQIITEHVNRLQCFQTKGMSAQFMKLANVWGVWRDLPLTEFVYPFSSMIAALLMDRGVIMAAEDIKAVAFDNPSDQRVASAAEKLAIEQAIRLIEPNLASYDAWLPPQSLTTAGTLQRWWLNYEFDLRIWDCAFRLHRDNEKIGDSTLTRWNVSYGQVTRIKKS
jgi:hypothetical protein